MAIRIPIITVFDSKGLKQAQYQLNKVRGNFQNLGRNATIAGVALGVVTGALGKSVKVASDLGESINAINVSFGKSAEGILDFGKTASTALGLSQVEFNNAAVRFSGFADKIVGAGNDSSKFIQDITTRAADFASVYNIDVADALQRFQSGLAGQTEPLAKFGVNLLDSEVKAYAVRAGLAKVGEELTATQKTQARYGLLMEATNKTSGDFANTSDSLANGMRILQAQFMDIQGEIGQALLPALQDILPTVRDLVSEFGTKLKTAVQAVDWKSLITSISNLLIFFVQNIEAITKVATALFVLNTAYNVAKVAIGLYNAAVVITNGLMAGTATATGLATGALTLFRTALMTTGIGAFVVALGFIIKGATEVDSSYRHATPVVASFGTIVRSSGKDAEWAASKYGIATDSINKMSKAALDFKPPIKQSAWKVASSFGGSAFDAKVAEFGTQASSGALTGGKGTKKKGMGLAATLKREGTLVKKEAKLVSKGLSAGLAEKIISSAKPIKTANKILARIGKNGSKAVKNLQKKFNATKAGRSELAAISAENSARDRAASNAADQAEKDRLAEKKRVYESFLDSVKNTFSRIQESILNAFSLPDLGTSTDSIIRNMKKLLTATKNFSNNITQLSQMGLSPELLQQVIAAGPMAGGRLAAALVAGGAGAISEISAGFTEFGGLASQIATTGTTSAFNTPTQQNIYNINVNGGVGSGATIGQSIVEAIKAYERVSGAVWQGA